MDKHRLEAFSDGVLAVAITLLVLDLHIDTKSQESLADQLWHQWPSFAAYAVSFLVIGVIWINHHAVFRLAAKVDRVLMFYNLLLLMFVTTIPFTTATLASYLHENTASSRLAVLLYGGAMTGMAISFTLILARITRAGLTHQPVGRPQANRSIRRFGTGCLIYPAITSVGLFSPTTMLALYAALTAFYILEQTPVLNTAETK
jgi:uncharacterized membrane protein